MRVLVVLCVCLTLLAHVVTLTVQGDPAAATPVSQLSRGELGSLHGVGLLSLALGWLVLLIGLWRFDTGYLWRAGCWLLVLCAAMLPYIAYYFATASDEVLFGAHANDPLAVLASLLGLAMGAFQVGLRRQARPVALANGVILFLWIALIPVIPFIEPGWLGAYERSVGALMLLWTLAMAFVSPTAVPTRS